GKDLVYRDPWGNPYIISVDLNYDEKTRDGFYRRDKVSHISTQPLPTVGYNGLTRRPTAPPNSNLFEAGAQVMVWSAGPDKMIDPTMPANTGANKDNVISWGR